MKAEPAPGQKALAWWRLVHPVPSLLTVVAAGAFVLLAYRGAPPLGRLALALAVETAMQFAISAFNDYFDRKVDAGRADKPVALGFITPRAAIVVGGALALLALALAVPLGAWVLMLTGVGMAAGLAYDAGLKYTALSWLPFSVAFPTLPLWAWSVAYPGGDFPAKVWWAVPVIAILVVGIHMADTIPDLEADKQAGVRGIAHRLGLRRALALCWGAFAATALLTLALAAYLPYRMEWYVPGLALGVALMCAGLALYLSNPSRVKTMALLLEVGAVVLSVGWIGAITL